MDKVKTGIYLERDIHEQFKKIAKERDIKQNQLFKEMLHCYLILNAKDQKEEK